MYGAPEPSGRTSRLGVIAVAGVAVVGVLLAGLFAVTSLTAADGADSPEGAVEHLFDALNDEDAIGALESLAPGERGMLVDPLRDIQAELTRLNVTSDFDLDNVPGVDLETSDLHFQVVKLADDIARVEVIGGTLTATTVPAEAPAGSLVTDQMAEDGSNLADIEPDAETIDFADDPLDLVAIERNGSWHVSLAYSIAEAARADSGGSFAKIGQGPAPVGSDSPEAAVRDMADALTKLSSGGDEAIEHLVTLLPPDELGVVYDYLPVWMSGGGYEEDDRGYERGYERSTTVEITDLELSSQGGGSPRRVRVDSFSLHVESTSTYTSYEGERSTSTDTSDVSFDGECFTTDYSYDTSDSSTSDSSYDDGSRTEELCKGDVDGYGDVFSSGLTNIATWSPTFTVVEVDGRWYVSPVRSVLDSTVEALRAMSPDDIGKLVDEWSDGFGAGRRFESVGEAIIDEEATTPTTFYPRGDDTTTGTFDPYHDDDFDRWNEMYEKCGALVDDLPYDSSDEVWDAAYEAYDRCLDEALGLDTITPPTTVVGESGN